MQKKLRIALTGVESTGKSTLATQLSAHYGAIYVPELAREYLANKATYTQEDVLAIAQKQIELQNAAHERLVFYDTELTVIKVWYETKYKTALPAHIQQVYLQQSFDLYLLPYPDLVWEADAMREVPDLQARLDLFQKYESELKTLQRPYTIIRGQARLKQALKAVEEFKE